ncbi:hypothetical protein HOU02_gp447 [Caulobacter phage CcrBL9]|uniref:Uncharacterized protein n=1 Tax=Caulobacter phage CcrBL9 TaxID=2283270 RepID=A0A385EET6_9CAUD|nr:hypothetical protein HOU02_gp447 [Caulobacter phage CcrBL9]AXQ69278.1 hypothetical protein CcrBL9_gp254c [Caulobacter phage CcrBL9]
MQIDIDVTPVEPGLILMKPITYGGRRWFDENVSPDSPKHNGAFVIEGCDRIDWVFGELLEEGLVAI